MAEALKTIQCAVNDRCISVEGTLPMHWFINNGNGQSQQHALQLEPSPSQQVFCELTQSYLKGYRDSFAYPGDQAEAGRKLLERVRQRRQEHPYDTKLNEAQRMALDLDGIYTQGLLSRPTLAGHQPARKGR